VSIARHILPAKKVSVIIPTYNRADLLRQALDSVFAQTHKGLEIIVVDDGSTDHTDKVLSEFGQQVKTIGLGRSGISSARNAGVDAATADYIAFLDNDDLWLPDKIEKHLDFATRHPESVVTYTDAVQFSGNGDEKRSFADYFSALKDPTHLFTPMITEYAVPLMSATMIDASFLKERDLRFQNFLGIDDLGLFLEIMMAGGKFAYLPEPLTKRRMHGGNFSGNHQRRFEQRKLLYADLLGRYSGRYTPEEKSALEIGLRDARYRVGESLWEGLQLKEARKEFLHTIGPDSKGIRSVAYALLTLFPSRFIAGARKIKP
jgi:glycosyltransferase involved in cell wall biosynthesis